MTADEAADAAPPPTEAPSKTEAHRWAAARRRDHALMLAGAFVILVTVLLELLVGRQLWMAIPVACGLGAILYGAAHRFVRLA